MLFAYYFPPLGGMGSLRALGLARHLPAAGVDLTVVAPLAASVVRDESLVVPDGVRVVRTGTLEPGVLLRRATSGAERAGAPAALGGGRAKQLFMKLLHVPDANVGWVPAAVRAALSAAKERRPDVVLSSSPPVSAHLAAAWTARRLRVPFVADVRDHFEAGRLFPGARARLDARIERRVLSGAAGVTAPYPGILESLREITDAPSLVVHNGYDEEDFAGPAEPPAEPLKIVHPGSTYGHRTDPRPFLAALKALVESGVDARLRLVGNVDPVMLSAIEETGTGDLVERAGFVTHARAIAEMRSAGILLLVAWARLPQVERAMLLGKTFECLRAGRPTLVLAIEGGETARTIEKLGGALRVDPADREGIRAALLELAAGRGPGPVAPTLLAPYSRRALARRLSKWLGGLVGYGA